MSLPGGPTKDEVMAVALFKLGLQRRDTFVDIGCGTGKVAIHAAAHVLKVHAIDQRREAVEYAKEEAAVAGTDNIEFHCGNALDILPRLGAIDSAFVGGSRDLPAVLSFLAERGVRSVVVNAVKLDTVDTAIAAMQELGIFREAVLVQVSRTHPIGPGLMWKPLDPVTVIVGGVPPC